jgi:hypothetical protein
MIMGGQSTLEIQISATISSNGEASGPAPSADQIKHAILRILVSQETEQSHSFSKTSVL